MEDIVIVSSKALPKRRRSEETDDRATKRTQYGEQSASSGLNRDDNLSVSGSDSDSEEDEDQHITGTGGAISATRISTEPHSTQNASILPKHIKTED